MDALQLWTGQVSWAMKNLAYNLDFIPDDKLDWKPAPEANSALEIVHHLAGAFAHITAAMQKANGESDVPEVSTPTKPATREAAKEQLAEVTQDFIALLGRVKTEDFNNVIDSPMGKMPFWFLLGMPAIDAIHHHGQIAYIQTLLGDAESHFDMSLLPKA